MKQYWLSWQQPGEDYRPLTFPPNEAILGWWCSGHGGNYANICALVRAESDKAAWDAVRVDWPDMGAQRFIKERDPQSALSDRFEPSDWMIPRIEAAR